jgi:hypothetical protein
MRPRRFLPRPSRKAVFRVAGWRFAASSARRSYKCPACARLLNVQAGRVIAKCPLDTYNGLNVFAAHIIYAAFGDAFTLVFRVGVRRLRVALYGL